jgi:L-rhamnose-H+ transport protein
MAIGLGLVVFAAFLQGIFLLPASRQRDWAWEHMWLGFSLFGMIVGNWILALLLLPNPLAIYAAVPRQDLLILTCFGVAWGGGAVLFGMGMDRLGLTLGYPLIMGLNASFGTVIPLLWLFGGSIFTGRRLAILAGTAIAVCGIAACSVAGARRSTDAQRAQSSPSRFVSGLIIAIAAGILSCLPNVGLTYGTSVLRAAQDLGASAAVAGNAVWLLFFTFGGIVNVGYCAFLMMRNHRAGALFSGTLAANWLWALLQGSLWICSFYFYGFGTARLGHGGSTIGWPVYISVSIGVGVLCGLAKGEWKGAPARARTLLWEGLALVAVAVMLIPMGNAGH